MEMYRVLASEGSFVKKVPEGTEGSRVRTYLNPKTETEETVSEDVIKAFTGYIRDISLEEKDWGEVLMITLVDSEGEVLISLNADSNFGTDFMKKIPNVDLTKEVRLAPYSFEDGDKKVRGITVEQEGEKIYSFFSAKDGDKVTSINGFPEPEGDTSKYTKKKWRDYFGVDVYNFLRDYTVDNIVPKFEDLPPLPEEVRQMDREAESVPNDEINAEDIPM